jgi:hypothetical protein
VLLICTAGAPWCPIRSCNTHYIAAVDVGIYKVLRRQQICRLPIAFYLVYSSFFFSFLVLVSFSLFFPSDIRLLLLHFFSLEGTALLRRLDSGFIIRHQWHTYPP